MPRDVNNARLVNRSMGTSYYFDGTASKAVKATAIGLSTSLVSIGCFYKIDGSAPNGFPWMMRTMDKVGVYYNVGSQTVATNFVIAGTTYDVGAFINPNYNWHHFAATYDGASIKVYLDGAYQKQTVATGVITGGNSNISAGVDGTSLFGFWQGWLDEVFVYNTALTQVQISNIVSRGMYDTTGLVSLWKFDEGSGISATDSSGNGNTGVITPGSGFYSSNVFTQAASRTIAGTRTQTTARTVI